MTIEFMQLYLLNYSDDRFNHKNGRFRQWQLNLNKTATDNAGILNIFSWQWEDLAKTEFYEQNKDYLNKSRFDNGAVWKPYIVLDTLNKINDGDIVLYSDSIPWGITRSVKPLVDLCLENNGIFFQQLRDQNSQWTKRDAFVYMDCDLDKYHKAPALQNTWFLIQKNEFNINFVSEWLKYNLDERIASYVKPNTCGLPNLPNFVENRGDQSIFTNLAIRYNIKTFYVTSHKNMNFFIDIVKKPTIFRGSPDLGVIIKTYHEKQAKKRFRILLKFINP